MQNKICTNAFFSLSLFLCLSWPRWWSAPDCNSEVHEFAPRPNHLTKYFRKDGARNNFFGHFRLTADSAASRAVISYWRKNVHLVVVINSLGEV